MAVFHRALAILFFVAAAAAAKGESAGLVARFTQAERLDALVLPNAAFFSPSGVAPTVFLQSGPYSLELDGAVRVELRGQYTFRALAKGEVELFVNGASVLRFTGTGNVSEPTKPIRLNRGTNALSVRFQPADSSDAYFQILWTSRNSPHPIPIPAEVLSHGDHHTAPLAEALQAKSGWRLFAEYRCGKCHTADTESSPVELDAPDFESIGSRLDPTWMARWIENPSVISSNAHMPRLFSGAEGRQKADAIAAYLATLQAEKPVEAATTVISGGRELFGKLLCSKCHAEGSLAGAANKFKPGALAAYLLNPHEHYRSNPMPNFKLSPDEAGALAGYLSAEQPEPVGRALSASAEDGKTLLQTTGCLSCHKSTLENRFKAPDFASITARPESGCTAEMPAATVPQFNFRPGERPALIAFLRKRDSSSLSRANAVELALRDLGRLGCAACHDQAEGIPRFSILGGKLRPEWSERFLAGEISYKPRPWLTARMPSFPAFAQPLAHGLAMLHGNAPVTPPETPVDSGKAEVGARLVSAAGGFSCVACHAVGSFTAGQVVESPGVNLAYSGDRLLPAFFHRWLLNPVAIEPSTKMPVYFDADGKSQLIEFYEGDGSAQIDAIWNYIRLGPKMPAPPVP